MSSHESGSAGNSCERSQSIGLEMAALLAKRAARSQPAHQLIAQEMAARSQPRHQESMKAASKASQQAKHWQSSHASEKPCRYDGPLEYFTMWLCMLLSRNCLKLFKNHGFTSKAKLLPNARASLSSESPLHPHPIRVLNQALRGDFWRQPS